MEKKGLVSVLMPAFNAEKHIEQAIDSILNQTYSHFELLIFDDGSSDSTAEICDVVAKKDTRVFLFTSPTNIGNLQATNFLFSKAQGEFIAIQDADDFSDINRFELQVQSFKDEPDLAVVGTQYVKINDSGSILFSGFLPCSEHEIREELRCQLIPVLYASAMVKASVASKAGRFRIFFNRQGYADMDWLARCSLYGKVKNLKFKGYYYREHPQSFSSSIPRKYFWSPFMFELLIEAHQQRIAGNHDFFEAPNIPEIRRFLSILLLKRGINQLQKKHKSFIGLKNIVHALAIGHFKREILSAAFYQMRPLFKTKWREPNLI
jgi:glycosyltransferase involved in cell wall biosynthesis